MSYKDLRKQRKCEGCGIKFEAKMTGAGIWQRYHNRECSLRNNYFARSNTVYRAPKQLK